MKKRTKKLVIGTTTTLLILAGMMAATAYYYLYYPQFHPTQKTYVYIDRDDTVDSIYNKVKEEGAANHPEGFMFLAKHRKYASHIHTGRYAIYPEENAYQLFNRLARGQQEAINLTIGSVRTLGRLARSIGKQLMIDSAEVACVINDTLIQQQWGYRPETMACMFIPDTYQVYWDISPKQLINRLQKEHEKFWNPQRKEKAQGMGMSMEEVCTLASIVEEETNNNPEKPMVAGLYVNRLRAGIPLQADPTVKFAMQDFGLRRITNKHLKYESPYNTYLHAGLPPGPIRIPSPIGIDAVLNFCQHNYIYMCAKEDFSGTHNFAATYTEHMQNARRYWRALNQRKIYK